MRLAPTLCPEISNACFNSICAMHYFTNLLTCRITQDGGAGVVAIPFSKMGNESYGIDNIELAISSTDTPIVQATEDTAAPINIRITQDGGAGVVAIGLSKIA
jgi:hypothetical protein